MVEVVMSVFILECDRYLVSWKETIDWLELLKESIILPLFFWLDKEVDTWGRCPSGCLCYLGAWGCLGTKVWGITLVQQAVNQYLSVSLTERHQLAGHEQTGLVQVAQALGV